MEENSIIYLGETPFPHRGALEFPKEKGPKPEREFKNPVFARDRQSD